MPDKLSINELSRRSGLNVAHVSRIMGGKVCPTLKTMLKLAGALGVTLDEFAKMIPKRETKGEGQ